MASSLSAPRYHYGACCAAFRRSTISQGFRPSPVAMAGVMRMLRCIFTKLVVREVERQGRLEIALSIEEILSSVGNDEIIEDDEDDKP